MSKIQKAIKGLDYIKNLKDYESDIDLQKACFDIDVALEELIVEKDKPPIVSVDYTDKRSSDSATYFTCPHCGYVNLLGSLLGSTSYNKCNLCGSLVEVQIPNRVF